MDSGSPTRQDSEVSELKKLYTVTKPKKRVHHAPDTQCLDCDFVAWTVTLLQFMALISIVTSSIIIQKPDLMLAGTATRIFKLIMTD